MYLTANTIAATKETFYESLSHISDEYLTQDIHLWNSTSILYKYTFTEYCNKRCMAAFVLFFDTLNNTSPSTTCSGATVMSPVSTVDEPSSDSYPPILFKPSELLISSGDNANPGQPKNEICIVEKHLNDLNPNTTQNDKIFSDHSVSFKRELSDLFVSVADLVLPSAENPDICNSLPNKPKEPIKSNILDSNAFYLGRESKRYRNETYKMANDLTNIQQFNSVLDDSIMYDTVNEMTDITKKPISLETSFISNNNKSTSHTENESISSCLSTSTKKKQLSTNETVSTNTSPLSQLLKIRPFIYQSINDIDHDSQADETFTQFDQLQSLNDELTKIQFQLCHSFDPMISVFPWITVIYVLQDILKIVTNKQSCTNLTRLQYHLDTLNSRLHLTEYYPDTYGVRRLVQQFISCCPKLNLNGIGYSSIHIKEPENRTVIMGVFGTLIFTQFGRSYLRFFNTLSAKHECLADFKRLYLLLAAEEEIGCIVHSDIHNFFETTYCNWLYDQCMINMSPFHSSTNKQDRVETQHYGYKTNSPISPEEFLIYLTFILNRIDNLKEHDLYPMIIVPYLNMIELNTSYKTALNYRYEHYDILDFIQNIKLTTLSALNEIQLCRELQHYDTLASLLKIYSESILSSTSTLQPILSVASIPLSLNHVLGIENSQEYYQYDLSHTIPYHRLEKLQRFVTKLRFYTIERTIELKRKDIKSDKDLLLSCSLSLIILQFIDSYKSTHAKNHSNKRCQLDHPVKQYLCQTSGPSKSTTTSLTLHDLEHNVKPQQKSFGDYSDRHHKQLNQEFIKKIQNSKTSSYLLHPLIQTIHSTHSELYDTHDTYCGTSSMLSESLDDLSYQNKKRLREDLQLNTRKLSDTQSIDSLSTNEEMNPIIHDDQIHDADANADSILRQENETINKQQSSSSFSSSSSDIVILRHRNGIPQSGRRGVIWHKAGKAWDATWTAGGKQHHRLFYIKDMGMKAALQQAIEFRDSIDKK